MRIRRKDWDRGAEEEDEGKEREKIQIFLLFDNLIPFIKAFSDYIVGYKMGFNPYSTINDISLIGPFPLFRRLIRLASPHASSWSSTVIVSCQHYLLKLVLRIQRIIRIYQEYDHHRLCRFHHNHDHQFILLLNYRFLVILY